MSDHDVTVTERPNGPETPAALPPGIAYANAFLVAPKGLEEAWKIAEVFSKSAFVPADYKGKTGDVFAAIQFGAEVGLPPMQALQGIAVINGRPAVWGDAALGLVEASGKLAGKTEHFEGEGDALTAVCRVLRKGKPEWVERRFSVADAKQAKLWGKQGPWTQYPQRMLQMRARAWALRDEFADVLKGLSIREEAIDIAREDYVVITEPQRASETGSAGSGDAAIVPSPIDTGGSTGTETPEAADPPATGLHKNVVSYMLGLAKACGVADATLTEHIGREYGVEALGDLTSEQAETVKGWLNEQRGAK
jgi:hypothetical protein